MRSRVEHSVDGPGAADKKALQMVQAVGILAVALLGMKTPTEAFSCGTHAG